MEARGVSRASRFAVQETGAVRGAVAAAALAAAQESITRSARIAPRIGTDREILFGARVIAFEPLGQGTPGLTVHHRGHCGKAR